MSETIKKAIDTINKALHDSEKFPVAGLAVRAERAAQQNPHDAPVITASNILKKMASTKTFITRAELNKLYDELYTTNTGLKELFAAELAREERQPAVFKRSEFENIPLDVEYEKLADPVLVNALKSAFDGEYRPYSAEMAKKATSMCHRGLKLLGVEPHKVEVFAGNEDVLVCSAAYETPKGLSHVLVPIEINDNAALFPNMFLSTVGMVELDKPSLETHIKSVAGKSFRVNADKLLEELTVTKKGVRKIASDVEMALMKLRAEKETPAAYDPNGILVNSMYEPMKDIEAPEYAKPPELESVAQKLSTGLGMAQHLFGERTVEAGRDMVYRKLRSFGYIRPQISVGDVENDTIYYVASLDNRAGVKIPVKIKDNIIHSPSIVISSGKVYQFSQEGMFKAAQGPADTRIMAMASPVYGLKAGELMDIVKEAIVEGNITKAEDAINVLGEVDTLAQKNAMLLLADSFSPDVLKKVASEAKSCSKIIKNSTSIHPVCGHLNLPLNKVFQDKHGNCHPIARKNQQDTNDGKGAWFMTHKVFL